MNMGTLVYPSHIDGLREESGLGQHLLLVHLQAPLILQAVLSCFLPCGSIDQVSSPRQGLKEVHHMLVEVAKSLIKGGETGVFTPMHLLLFRKPESSAQ